MERRRADRQRRLGLHPLLRRPSSGAAEHEDAVDVGAPELAGVAVGGADVQHPRQPEAVLGLQVRARDERAGDVLVEHRLAEAPRDPVPVAGEAALWTSVGGRRAPGPWAISHSTRPGSRCCD